MVAFDYIVLGLLVLLIMVLFGLISENKKQRAKIEKLGEILKIKDTTIHNLEASRVTVKDVIDNLSISDEVIAAIESGMHEEEVSKTFGIPLSKIELIVKFDKIKKEQNNA